MVSPSLAEITGLNCPVIGETVVIHNIVLFVNWHADEEGHEDDQW